MLNELLGVERGARQAGIEMVEGHPDVKDARRMPTLLIRLDPDGSVAAVHPTPAGVTPWTLRDGQHNSFPFVQPKLPLWLVAEGDMRRDTAGERKNDKRREAILSLAAEAQFNARAFESWPSDGLVNRVRERRQQLASLDGTQAGVVLATMDRFLLTCKSDTDSAQFLQTVAGKIVEGLRQSAQREWLEVAVALLLGTLNKKTNQWESSGALLFEAAAAEQSIVDPRIRASVSELLRRSGSDDPNETEMGLCALTGNSGALISGNFPQPNLPVLGQTFLFAKNRDIPANDRYGRFAAQAMPVGLAAVIRLSAALEALTADDRRGVTWRAIPGEGPKQSDLLLAFVDQAPEEPLAGALADDEDEEDFSEELPLSGEAKNVGSVAAFEKRTERLIDAVKAKVGTDFRQTPVRVAILRKVDPANRKVVYAGAPTVGDLYGEAGDRGGGRGATGWAAGEQNVPSWLTLPVLRKGEPKARAMSPPHVAPLGLIRFSKQLYTRAGTQAQEFVGLPAGEALALFLDSVEPADGPARQRVRRVLRLVLLRRAPLLVGTSHALRRGFDFLKEFDRREALRTVTVLSVLLYKLERTKEAYMTDPAFKLGQLLAGADVVHAGYCADVRRGDLPPSLLGNQVFTMAQKNPLKALDLLCRRWKPYAGWAEKAARAIDPKAQLREDEKMRQSNDRRESQRGWDISKALSVARRIKPLADELRPPLEGYKIDEAFRAELLLGYIAGLPKAKEGDAGDRNGKPEAMEQES